MPDYLFFFGIVAGLTIVLVWALCVAAGRDGL
jgi:hypothetical protein